MSDPKDKSEDRDPDTYDRATMTEWDALFGSNALKESYRQQHDDKDVPGWTPGG